jgi:hypothetical protein
MEFHAELVNLAEVNFTPELLRCIPPDVARKYRVLPILDRRDCLAIALGDPEDFNTLDALAHILQKPELEVRVANRPQLDKIIQNLYGD